MTTVLGILILVCALFLIVSILLQSSKNHRMSGVVSGGADTFFGKQKGKTIDAKLSKLTAVISVVFCALILVLYFVTSKANTPAENTDNVQLPIENAVIDTETAPEAEVEAEVVPEAEAETEAAPEAEAETEAAPEAEAETEAAPEAEAETEAAPEAEAETEAAAE